MVNVKSTIFRDGLPKRNLELDTENNKQRYGYLDPYVNVTGKPFQPRVNNWTYIMTDTSYHNSALVGGTDKTARYFRIGMNQILQMMGSLQGIQVKCNVLWNHHALISVVFQVRAEVYITDFLYNNSQKAWCETRIINNTLDLSFVGSKPLVFKPGMPFDAQIAVRYADQVPNQISVSCTPCNCATWQVPLDQEKLEMSALRIQIFATFKSGQTSELPEIM